MEFISTIRLFAHILLSIMESLRQFKADTRQIAVPKNGISRVSRYCRRQVSIALQTLAPCRRHLHTYFILLTQPRLSNITPQQYTNIQVTATSTPGVLQKLARVFKEKAAQDLELLMKGTTKTREKLGVVEELFAYWTLEDADQELEELEDALIMSDFGPKTSFKIVDAIRERVKLGELKTGPDLRKALKESIINILQSRGGGVELNLGDAQPAVILIVGVNGGGKTTTIGKLAAKFAGAGAKVVMGAGDTFRAAAAEQLEEWARRADVEIVRADNDKARPDAVLFKAVEYGKTSGADIVLCDTSGRLHTNIDLMEELAKCKRSVGKAAQGAPHETLLVLDGTTGLNMTNQAREFNITLGGLSGIILTKLDGTARGGAVVSVVDELGVPVKFVGVGEGLEDLRQFDIDVFVEALFPESK